MPKPPGAAVFQRYTLFPHLSVGENVAFPLRIRRRPQAEIAERVKASLMLRPERLSLSRASVPSGICLSRYKYIDMAFRLRRARGW